MAKYSKKVMGKEVGDASVYAPPHTMTGKKLSPQKSVSDNQYGNKTFPTAGDVTLDTMTPGVTMGATREAKTSGIKIRGTGAATKGTMARGPMA